MSSTKIDLCSGTRNAMECVDGSIIAIFLEHLNKAELNTKLEASIETCQDTYFHHMNQFGQRPLAIAASLSDITVENFEALIEKEKSMTEDLDFRATAINFTALITAVKSGNISFAIMLIKAGANPFLTHQPDNTCPCLELIKYCNDVKDQDAELSSQVFAFFEAALQFADEATDFPGISPFLETITEYSDPIEFNLISTVFPTGLLEFVDSDKVSELLTRFSHHEAPFQYISDMEYAGLSKYQALQAAIQNFDVYTIAQILNGSDPDLTADELQQLGTCFYHTLRTYEERFEISNPHKDSAIPEILPVFEVIFNSQFGIPKDLCITLHEEDEPTLLKEKLLSLFGNATFSKEHKAITEAYTHELAKIEYCDALKIGHLRHTIASANTEGKIINSAEEVIAEQDLFFQACQLGDIESIDILLTLGWMPDYIHPKNISQIQTPLVQLLTLEFNHGFVPLNISDVVAKLISIGASPEATDENGNTALTLAAASKYNVFAYFKLESVPPEVLLPEPHHVLTISPLYAAL